MHQLNSEDKDTMILVRQYEAMLRKHDVRFFEKSNFERLLDYYEQRHQINLALEVVNYALEQHPYSVSFFVRKAQFLLEKNQIDDALDFLEKAEILDASELDIYLLKSELYSWTGNYDEALKILHESLNLVDPEEIDEIFLGIANVYEDMELFNKSFEALGNALMQNPSNKTALDRIWLLVELSGKYAESVKLHESVLNKDPYAHQAWYNLGHAQFCLGNYEEAVESFEYAIVIDEEFEFAYRDCAEALYRLGQFERAIECYEDALEYIKPDADLFTNLGLCYEELGLIGKAKTYYLEAIKIDPHSDSPFFRLGECYVKEQRWVSAVSAFNKAIKLNSQNADYVAALAETYVQTETYDKAAQMFRIATELAPEESQKWVQFASFLLMIDQPAMALEVIEEAQVYCSSSALDYCQAATLYGIGYHQAAKEKLIAALEEDYDLNIILFDLIPELRENMEVLGLIEQYRAPN